MCLDSLGMKSGNKLGLYPCHGQGNNQVSDCFKTIFLKVPICLLCQSEYSIYVKVKATITISIACSVSTRLVFMIQSDLHDLFLFLF